MTPKEPSEPQGIRSILLLENHRCLKKGMRISPKEGVNLFVGDQGCGKTSLLELLKDNDPKLELDLNERTRVEGTPLAYLDTEKMNPRVAEPRHELRSMGQFQGHLSLMWASHGEVIHALIHSSLKELSGIILIDEPESGLSLRSQYKIAAALKKAAKRGCQIFIASHSTVLMEAFPENVFSMEHMEWMPAKEFILSQKTKRT